MVDHQAGVAGVSVMAGAFIKRPGMFIGSPIRFDRATAFIAGYTLAIDGVKGALSEGYDGVFHPPGVEGQFRQQLRDEGRLRWDRWDLTIAAEAIGWTDDEPPKIDDFTEEQHRTAIESLAPLLERVLSLPKDTVASFRQEG
jgi:hypothetical protein